MSTTINSIMGPTSHLRLDPMSNPDDPRVSSVREGFAFNPVRIDFAKSTAEFTDDAFRGPNHRGPLRVRPAPVAVEVAPTIDVTDFRLDRDNIRWPASGNADSQPAPVAVEVAPTSDITDFRLDRDNIRWPASGNAASQPPVVAANIPPIASGNILVNEPKIFTEQDNLALNVKLLDNAKSFEASYVNDADLPDDVLDGVRAGTAAAQEAAENAASTFGKDPLAGLVGNDDDSADSTPVDFDAHMIQVDKDIAAYLEEAGVSESPVATDKANRDMTEWDLERYMD